MKMPPHPQPQRQRSHSPALPPSSSGVNNGDGNNKLSHPVPAKPRPGSSGTGAGAKMFRGALEGATASTFKPASGNNVRRGGGVAGAAGRGKGGRGERTLIRKESPVLGTLEHASDVDDG
ncbi:hypothetical protein HDU76_011004, partial [Blyttiomyces sp. JEL0837]